MSTASPAERAADQIIDVYPLIGLHRPDIHPRTFGKPAVMLAEASDYLAYSSNDTDGLTQNNQDYVEKVETQISEVRNALSGLQPYQEIVLEDYCEGSVPPLLARQKNKTILSWVSWLGVEASDKQLINFLQWHIDTLAAQQHSPEVQRNIDKNREIYKLKVFDAIREGWLDEYAFEAVRKVDDVRVYIGDVFDTLMEERGGYHTYGTKEIVIAGSKIPNVSRIVNWADVAEALKIIQTHEYNHAVLGRLGGTWMNEALTEHIAQSLHFGHPEVIKPVERLRKTGIYGSYVSRRDLLSTILERGNEVIPIELLTKAYSSTNDFFGYNSNAIGKAIDRAWGQYAVGGDDAVKYINRYVGRLEVKYEHSGYTKMQAQEMAALDVSRDLWQQPELVFKPVPMPIKGTLSS